MNRLSRSQKKGKVSAYNSRFLKNKETTSSYIALSQNPVSQLYVSKLDYLTKSNCVTAQIRSVKNPLLKAYWPAPLDLKVNSTINSPTQTDTLVIKPLKQYHIGTKVCVIEYYKDSNKYYCTAAGTCATIAAHDQEQNKTTVVIKKRAIKICSDYRAMRGVLCNANFHLKPKTKAGIASKIAYARGKKYPIVSAHKMNILDHHLGGSCRRSKNIKCSSHRAPPGRKCGHISPRRTGRAKK